MEFFSHPPAMLARIMTTMKSSFLAWALALGLASGPLHAQNAASSNWAGFDSIDFNYKLLMLGTSLKGGTLHLLGDAICAATNKHILHTKLRCGVIETTGSEFNVMAVTNDFVQLGLAQGDSVRDLSARYEEVDQEVRLVTSFGTQNTITVYVRQDVQSLQDLRGRVFNIGARGSGSASNAQSVLRTANLPADHFSSVEYLGTGEAVEAFCAGRIDAGALTFFHPNDTFRRIFACNGKILELPADHLERLQRAVPTSVASVIAAGAYGSSSVAVRSVSVPALLLTSRQVDAEAVYRFLLVYNRVYPQIRARAPFIPGQPTSIEELKSLGIELHPGVLRAHGAPAAPR